MFFYRIVSNTERLTTSFEEMAPQEVNKCFQKFYLPARKHVSHLASCAPKL